MSQPETTPLLLEIGCEEIPARFLEDAERGLGEALDLALRAARLLPQGSALGVKTASTPRRLLAYVPELLRKQPGHIEKIVGPSVKAAFDKEGKPTRAAESFAAKMNVKVSDLMRATTAKGEYLALEVSEAGQPALQVLVEVMPAVLGSMTFPKNMYWTAKTGPFFVRPIRWILALLGEGESAQVVPFEFAGVQSGNFTFGHRVKGGEPIHVTGFDHYLRRLREHWVEPDPAARLECIRNGIKALLEGGEARVVVDEWLEKWVVNSTEYPVPLMGSFDRRYLALPREVLVTVMRDHQKYFALEDKDGNLQPQFITVLNVPGDPKGLIRQGHERVLSARFADAEFFWSADQKIGLAGRIPMLERVTYQAKLGTYADKVRRMKALAEKICEELEKSGSMNAQERRYALRAVELCKCDLTTQMVQEFTELQGIMGGLYARAQGEPPSVADAIYDHYRPSVAEDSCPRSVVGAVVSLADKLDSVVAGFSAGLEPTGSSDPFGLRRAGNGVIRLAVETLAGLNLTMLVDQLLHLSLPATGVPAVVSTESENHQLAPHPAGSAHPGERAVASAQSGELGPKVDGFLRERMEFYFREVAGLRYDTVRAVLRPTELLQDLVPSQALSRAKALERARDTDDFRALASAAKRTRNIRKSANAVEMVGGQPDPALFTEEPERELYAAYQVLSQEIKRLSDVGNFEEAFRGMAAMRPHVDCFFDKVMVMVDDAAIRRNRLLLLLRLSKDVFTSLADLAEISVESRPRAVAG